MKVLYAFCESSCLRVPFFTYDNDKYDLLISHGGTWDYANREIILRGDIDAEQFTGMFPGVPCVWVNKDSPEPVQIYGFFGRPWRKAYMEDPVLREEPADANLVSAFALRRNTPPEKFSEHWQIKLEAELRSRKYSPRTRRSYLYYNRLFCNTLQKTPNEIIPDDITPFLAAFEKDRNYSASSINLAISAIRFFYKNIMKNESITDKQRPRKDGRLPQVLSKTEIHKILSMEKNPKHRLLLMLAYSSGLRVSEVVSLKKEHIDLSRKVIYVRLGKGRKDRCTLLSERAAQFLTEYCDFYNIQNWLFPGQNPTHPLTIRSAQHIFDKAVRCAEIHKEISIHSLRHTFATHLLETGIDIRYIQTLLGHANLRTTERYTHIARRSVLSIQSPLDTIP